MFVYLVLNVMLEITHACLMASIIAERDCKWKIRLCVFYCFILAFDSRLLHTGKPWPITLPAPHERQHTKLIYRSTHTLSQHSTTTQYSPSPSVLVLAFPPDSCYRPGLKTNVQKFRARRAYFLYVYLIYTRP